MLGAGFRRSGCETSDEVIGARATRVTSMRSSVFLAPPNPAPSQALLVSLCKHRYYLKGGGLRYTERPLTAETRKNRLRTYLLCDEQSDAFFAEIRPAREPIDVLGFLTRAWTPKPWHFFQGLPQQLSVPAALMRDQAVHRDLERVYDELPVRRIATCFPPWYAHIVGRFDREVDSLYWRWRSRGLDWVIGEIDAIGAMACLAATIEDRAIWNAVVSRYPRAAVPEWWLEEVDRRYQHPGAWRQLLHAEWPPLE